MRVLLHICCAPCAVMPLATLRGEGHEVMGLFYNPNIQPYTENQRRRDTVRDWAQAEKLHLIFHDEYDPEWWFRQMAFREALRCSLCYNQRLTRTAQVAQKGDFEAFTSSLLYSVRQKHDKIKESGEAAAMGRKPVFLYRDFRLLWQEGVAASKEQRLYRQQYCGCLYSERDRYLGAARKKPRGKKHDR